jgi:hypothetical protein
MKTSSQAHFEKTLKLQNDYKNYKERIIKSTLKQLSDCKIRIEENGDVNFRDKSKNYILMSYDRYIKVLFVDKERVMNNYKGKHMIDKIEMLNILKQTIISHMKMPIIKVNGDYYFI